MSHDVQFEQLHHQTFHPIQLKGVRGIITHRFCFVLNLWPQAKVKVTESGKRWQRPMVPICRAGIKGFSWNEKFFAMKNRWTDRLQLAGQPADWPDKHNWLYKSMLLIWIKNWYSSGHPARCQALQDCAGTGWPSVNTLWLGETASLTWNFYLSVATHTAAYPEPSLGYTSMLLGC